MELGLNSIVSVAVGILAVWAIAADSAHDMAPAPAADCSTVISSLVDCLSFVSNGSSAPKPEKTCCSGLKTVLKTNPDCLCEGFKNSAALGVNLTKAMTLPTACKVHPGSSLPKCIPKSGNFFPSPSAAPSASPSSSGISSAPTGTPAASATAPAASSPSPSQVNSASSPVAATLSAAAFLVAFLV